MVSMIHPVHFKDLAAKDPSQIVQCTGAVWDAKALKYRINVWGVSHTVDLSAGWVWAKNSGRFSPSEYMDLFIVHYLMTASNLDPAGDWVSEKDIPGGSAFFRGPHTLPVRDIARTFGMDIKGFEASCTRFGGRPLAMGDSAFVFDITPKLPVGILLWLGDDDFEAEAGLLFDRTIARHLALDIIYALGVLVCSTLCAGEVD